MTDVTEVHPRQDTGLAQSRVDLFTDNGSFLESGRSAWAPPLSDGRRPPRGDGVVTGSATVDGRPVGVYAQDSTVLGGSLGAVHARKVEELLAGCLRRRTPVVGLLDSAGARIQEGVDALDGYGRIFRRNVQLSGRVPQLSVVLGACAGGAVYSPALTDLVVMSESARMFLTGPDVVRAVTGEKLTADELGGFRVHSRRSGVAQLTAPDDRAGLALARRVLGYLPSSCWEPPPWVPPGTAEPMPEVPDNPRKAYDVRGVVRGVVDRDSFLELQPHYAEHLVIGFARVEGRPVGVVANQPLRLAGVLDAAAAEKGARFVRLCDAFGLPLVVLVDTPGFLPGAEQENSGVIRRGAKLLYAFCEAVVPRVTVVLRKAYGGAYIVMNSRSVGADCVFAWPGAELAVMGAEGAVAIVHRRELAAYPERMNALVERYRGEAMAADNAAQRLSVDAVIAPADTRRIVALALSRLPDPVPGFRHDNLPQ